MSLNPKDRTTAAERDKAWRDSFRLHFRACARCGEPVIGVLPDYPAAHLSCERAARQREAA